MVPPSAVDVPGEIDRPRARAGTFCGGPTAAVKVEPELLAGRRGLESLRDSVRQLLDLVGLRDDPEHPFVEKLLGRDVEAVSGAQDRPSLRS
jgi:hypothetical protein